MIAHMGWGPLAERFWRSVHKTDGCWLWNGARNYLGYGQIKIAGKLRRATHAALIVHGSDVPGGSVVLHSCDNPRCVRPSHLSIGTQAENVADMLTKKRDARGSRRGTAKLSEADVLSIRARFAAGSSMYRLAKDSGVAHSTIRRLILRRTWTHI